MRPRTSALVAASVIAVLVAWVATGAGSARDVRTGSAHGQSEVTVPGAGSGARVVLDDGRSSGGERWRGQRPLLLMVAAIGTALVLLCRRRALPAGAAQPAGIRRRWPAAGRAPPAGLAPTG